MLAANVVFLMLQPCVGKDVFRLGVCGGFTDEGLPGDCCWPEALGMEVAKLAWDRGAFSTDSAVGVLEPPPEGKADFEVDMTISDLDGDAGKGVVCAINQWTGEDPAALVMAAGWSNLAIPVATVGPAVGGSPPLFSDLENIDSFLMFLGF